ncbi:pre-mRNA splicing regulator USH1G [Condylostylus longicornis]|uniref:pre-mRNA splicing regulator USH1G n=1 Tax=Condylostylus longicornis TaxID=2530218 RepID=UPI00244DFACE|nr:pre-mRNA splicing regulator USH1G [Condylostylus longicornis]
MSSDRFHKAAKDGLLEVLKDATRRDANSKDADSMTPVLWAAFEGRLDALRLLVGRGGEPDKCDQFGNTALHLAAAKGHMHCVDFLVKFGVNLYSLDIDKHSAKDLAAINNRDDILRYLDTATANFEISERKKAKAMKELAEKNCEKRIKEYAKRQQRLEQELGNVKPPQPRPSMLATLKHKIWSSSHGNLKNISNNSSHEQQNSNVIKFSDLVGSGSVSSRSGKSAVQKKAFESKMKQQRLKNQERMMMMDDNGFKIGEIEADGKRTITSLTGLQRDSEVLYVGTFSSNEESGKRGKIADVFDVDTNSDIEHESQRLGYGTLSRSFSQPDFTLHNCRDDDDDDDDNDEISNDIRMQRPTSLFDRPIGSLAFRRSVTAALSQLHPDSTTTTNSSSRKNASSLSKRMNKGRPFLGISDSDSDGGTDTDDDQEDITTPIQRFLAVLGLEEYYHIFQKQQIDLDTLMLLTESDLKTLNLPLGPFRKLVIAIQERKNAFANPGVMQDSRL